MSSAVHHGSGTAMSRIMGRAASYGLVQKSAELNNSASSVAKRLSTLAEQKDQLYTQMRILEQASRTENSDHDNETPESAKNQVLDALEQMNTNLEEFLDHVSLVIDKKDVVTSYMQTPFSADFLPVEAGHHADFLELFREMSHFLLGFHNTLTSMEWASHFNSAESQLDRKLWSLCSQLAKCQRYHDALSQWEELYRDLS